MKLTALATSLPLLLLSFVAHATASRDVFQARQAHVKKGLVDICASVDIGGDVSIGGQNLLLAKIEICLCLSLLPDFLSNHPVARQVVDKCGQDDARDYFTNVIQGQKGKQECHFPNNAVSACSTDCPCDFTCQSGYSRYPDTNPTDCVCNPPYSECNGVCGHFPRGCSSQGMSSRRRDQSTCPAGKTMCGVPNGGKGHDCVDTKTDRESCGGCTVPSPFGNNGASGKNCKTIPNVDKVLCDNGTCKVLSCKNGFKVSRSNDSCIQPRLNRVRNARGVGL